MTAPAPGKSIDLPPSRTSYAVQKACAPRVVTDGRSDSNVVMFRSPVAIEFASHDDGAGSAVDDAEQLARRPVPVRDTGWAHRTAPKLQRLGLTPNQISIASVVFAAVAAACFVASVGVDDGSRIVLLIAAAMMPLRLLCNLFDGMLAVKGGMKQDSLCATRDEMDTKGMLSGGFPRVYGLAAACWIQRVARRPTVRMLNGLKWP